VKGAEPSRVGKEPAKNTDEEVRKYTESIIRISLIYWSTLSLLHSRLGCVKKYQVYRLDPPRKSQVRVLAFSMDPVLDGSRSRKILRIRSKCGGYGMFIPDPDFYPSRLPDLGSRIQDPKTATKGRSEKKISLKLREICGYIKS
jgi:hypothetical protein